MAGFGTAALGPHRRNESRLNRGRRRQLENKGTHNIQTLHMPAFEPHCDRSKHPTGLTRGDTYARHDQYQKRAPSARSLAPRYLEIAVTRDKQNLICQLDEENAPGKSTEGTKRDRIARRSIRSDQRMVSNQPVRERTQKGRGGGRPHVFSGQPEHQRSVRKEEPRRATSERECGREVCAEPRRTSDRSDEFGTPEKVGYNDRHVTAQPPTLS